MSERIRTLIVDDEPLAREGIRVLLAPCEDIEIVGECANGAEALACIPETRPDLLFLDVQMPEMDGFELLTRLTPEQIPVVVFVTAFDRYALRAFEVHALDYLLKPFDDSRFAESLDRARQHIRRRESQQLSERLLAAVEDFRGGATPATAEAPRYLSRISVKSGGRVYFLKTDDIDWFEAADYYVKLHVGERAHLLRESMNHLESRLDPERFFRLHRSTIVNLDRVKELRSGAASKTAVVLHDGTRLRLSRSRKEQLHRLLGQSLD